MLLRTPFSTLRILRPISIPISIRRYRTAYLRHTTNMIRPRLRIAILECDEPVGKTKERYGGYGNLFQELLENSAEHIARTSSDKRPVLEMTNFDVVNKMQYPRLEDVDAVLLTGSSMSIALIYV